MKPGRLFWRVLLAFVLVNVLSAALFVAVLRPVLGALNDPRERYAPLAEQAVAEYEQGTRAEFVQWLRRVNRKQGFKSTLLDTNGQAVVFRLPRGMESVRPLIDRGAGHKRLPGGAVFLSIPVSSATANYRWVAIVPPRQDPGQHRLVLLLRVLLSVLVIAIASWWLTRWLVRPVQDLTAATQAFGGGDLGARAGETAAARRDEIGHLARSFNQMASHTEALVAARNRLLGDVSHELRSPLARLNVALELARENRDSAAALDRIEQESQRMDALIGDALHVARAQGPLVKRSAVDLVALVRAAVDDLRFELGEAVPPVHVAAPGALTVSGDPELLRRAVDNILRNAARYGADGPQIDIALHRDKATILSVRDYGPGIGAAELPRIFQPFYRTATARDRTSGGHGIGLAIVAEAAARHGGRAYAELPEGGGLRVVIQLPN